MPLPVTWHRRPARSAVVALALLVVALASCRRQTDVALQPVVRLADRIETPQAARVPRRCAVADESRPALGCPTRRDVLTATLPFPEGPVLEMQAPLPGELARGRVVLETSLLTNEVAGWKTTPPVVLEGEHPGVTLALPLPEGLERADTVRVRIVGQAIPERRPHLRTSEITIGPHSILEVGLAIDPIAGEVGATGTVFRIDVHGRFGVREILRTTVLPQDSRDRWIDRRVDLAALAGERVRFELHTDLVPPAAGDPRGDWTLPIWGNPQILEGRPRNGQRNVVLVSLDTMRGDFVGATYEGRELTPGLDARARQGTRFRQVLAPYPSTSASHMSLFTSTYPAQHKVLHAKHILSPALPTLAEIFAANAYETAAFTEDGMLAAAAGFDRGFDDYYENRGLTMWDARGDIEHTLDRGLQWLGRHRGEKFFLFLHSYQVHTPYEPPARDDVFHSPPRPGEKPRIVRMRDHYAGEVRYTDRVLRRLFDTISRLGLDDETIVVVTADHGDEFGEHGKTGHSFTVYDEVLLVPLLFWAPGLIPPGVTIDEQVSLIDVGPTLLDLVHVAPVPALRGESLAPLLLEGAPSTPTVRFAEGPSLKNPGGRLFSVRTGRYKWIARENIPDPLEVYDLQTDPEEKHNLARDSALRERGRKLLETYRSLDAGAPEARPPHPVDTRTQDKLRALGYTD